MARMAYTLHKPARRRLKRNRVIVNGKEEQWQADLVDVQALNKDNDGFSSNGDRCAVVICLGRGKVWSMPSTPFSKRTVESLSVCRRMPEKNF